MEKNIKKVFGSDKINDICEAVLSWSQKTAKYMEEREYKSAVQAYEDIQLYMWRRLLENTKNWFWWSSNEKYPLIANAWKTYSWMMSRLNLNKVIISTYMPSVNDDIKKGIPVYKNFVKFALNKPETKSAITEIMDEALAVWTAYWRISWKKQKRKIVKNIKEWNKNGQKKIEYDTIERWYPIIKYCSYFNVLRDLSDNNRYIWERYFATKEQLNKDYTITPEDRIQIEDGSRNSIFRYDYNKVKNISSWDVEIKWKCSEVCWQQYSWWERRNYAKNLPKHDNWYTLDKNWLYEVFDIDIDWYEETYNVVMINWYVIHAWESEQPFPWPKIIQLNFEKMPWEVFWRWIGWMGRWYQSSVDTLYNSYLNSVKILTNPQFTQEETLTWNNSKTFNYVPWWIIPKSSGAYTLERIELVKATDTQNNLQAIQTIEWKFSSDLWLNPYVTGQSWWIERSAEWVRQRKLWTDNKVAKFLDNVNIFFSEAVEKMALLQMVFWKDVFEEIQWESVSFKVKDILTWYRVTFDWEDILWEKSAKTQEAISLLSAISPFNLDPDTQEQIVDPKKLLRTVFDSVDMYEMVPDAEKRLEEIRIKTDYMKKKREILAELQWPTDPFDKQNMNISISWKDLMDIPEAREKILKSIWIDVMPQQPAKPMPQQELTPQTEQASKFSNEPVGRWFQVQ